MSDTDPNTTVMWMMAERLRKPKLPESMCWKVAEPAFCMILEPMLGTAGYRFFRHISLFKKTYMIRTQQNFLRLMEL